MIMRLELAPGDVVREEALQRQLGIGRTPIREALQRLARDQFVTVMPRRGMFVSRIDVSELSMLYETRAMLEPYAARLACAAGPSDALGRRWRACSHVPSGRGGDAGELIEIDRECHEIIWAAAGNRFLTDTLDMLYAQSDRALAHVPRRRRRHAARRRRAPPILDALVDGDADRAAALVEAHVRSFDEQVRAAVTRRLGPPLAGT